LRKTAGALHIVGSAAGPVGGDRTDLDVEVTAGATLVVRTVAAQLVFPGARGEPSHAATTAVVGPGATLRWLPEPVVAVRGADHRSDTRIAMAGDAVLVWRDIAVLGRHDEASGSLRQRLRVDRDGRPLVCNELQLGPAWPHASGPTGTGGRRVVATVLVVGGERADAQFTSSAAVRVGVCELATDAVLVTALADSVEDLAPVLAAFAAP
jgi:urease accessory protein